MTLLLLIVAVLALHRIVRLFTRPYNSRINGYNPYRYGVRRHHQLLGRILPILALVALDRFLGGRRF